MGTSSSATEHIEFPHLTLLKTQEKINDASQIEQPEEEGGRGCGQGSQEDQAARERRQERQAKEAGNAGKEGCRQVKEIWLVKACGVDGFYARLENGVMLSLFKKTRSAKRFDS